MANPEVHTTRLRTVVEATGDQIMIRINDLAGNVWSELPYVYSVGQASGETHRGLTNTKVQRSPSAVVVRGQLSGTSLQVKHRLKFSSLTSIDESIQITNEGKTTITLSDVGFGFGRLLSSTDNLRLVACPFRRQADGKLHDYNSEDLLAKRFSNSNGGNDAAVTDNKVCDDGVLRSEAWILTGVGAKSLLVAKYNWKHIEHSVAAVQTTTNSEALRFGGAGLSLFREPRGSTQLSPGASFQFGTTRLQLVDGDWQDAHTEYRDFLNAKGHGIPPDYAPPLNWNELFDIGWYHSDRDKLAQHYTREALLAEAAKAKEVGCDLLYLDPGWEVCEGTTLWDEPRLGKVQDFTREVKERFGLRVGFRTIGRVYRDEFPNNWYLKRETTTDAYERPYLTPSVESAEVPLARKDGCRNLCLFEGTTVTASSVIPGYGELHKVEHLTDGWYNNTASWVAEAEPSWIQVDFDRTHQISEVTFGSEHTPAFRDHAISAFDLLLSDNTITDTPNWTKVLSYNGEPIAGTRAFSFEPISATRVRIEVKATVGGTARIDELEVYEAVPGTAGEYKTRRARPPGTAGKPIDFWEVCTQSPEWQKEKLKRILAVADGGFDFMMYDEFDWRGACYDSTHGHPVPSTPEGHVKAVYNLVEKMRDHYPHMLVEAHDPVWPWSSRYLPTYFQQSFTGNRYQENWGFEFMWHPIQDLKSGRAMCLYYYNLGCDIPLYDHITMESDNDASLSFWWYASTVRHLGIGGKKGLNSKTENPARWEQYKKAVAEYNRLREFYSRGRFVGIEETAHLHVHPTDKAAVLNLYNLTNKPQSREVRIDTVKAGLGKPETLAVTGAKAQVKDSHLVLHLYLPPETPALAEIRLK